MKKVILAIVAVGLTVGLIAQMDLKKNDGSTKQVGTTAVGGTKSGESLKSDKIQKVETTVVEKIDKADRAINNTKNGGSTTEAAVVETATAVVEEVAPIVVEPIVGPMTTERADAAKSKAKEQSAAATTKVAELEASVVAAETKIADAKARTQAALDKKEIKQKVADERNARIALAEEKVAATKVQIEAEKARIEALNALIGE